MAGEKNNRSVNCLDYFCVTCVLLLISALFPLNTFAQYFPAPAPVGPEFENQLLLSLNHAKSDSQKVHLLLSLSNLYYNKPVKNSHDLDLGLKRAAQARDISTRLRDKPDFDYAQYYTANIFMLKDDFTGAERILNTVSDSTKIKLIFAVVYRYLFRTTGNDAENLASAKKYLRMETGLIAKHHDRIQEIQLRTYQALIDLDAGDLKKAENGLHEVLHQYQVIGYKKLQYCYHWLTMVNIYSGDYDKALENTLESVKAMQLTKDILAGGDFYMDLATIYDHSRQYQKVIEACLTAVRYYKVHAAEQDALMATTIMVDALIHLHKNKDALNVLEKNVKIFPPTSFNQKKLVIDEYGECYLALKQYARAEKYYLLGFNMDKGAKSLNFPSYERMGYFYIELKEYAKAKPYLDSAMAHNKELSSTKAKIHLNFMMFLADSALGHYLSAIKLLRINNEFDHTVYAQSKMEDMQKLLVQYETEKKNSEIQLLKQKELLQQSNLKRAYLIKNITIGTIVLMTVICALLYKNYKQKQSANMIITQKNDMLQRLLNEKEWLLKEIHHRVKNNLHTVISLLEAQAVYLENDALKAIENSQNRIYTMSLIHQKLYQSDDIKTIDMDVYIPELAQYLEDSFDSASNVHFNLKIDPVSLNISYAIPLGLIINEAVTNSIKYAFPNNKKGEITISLIDDGKKITLIMADNGIGIPKNIHKTELNSLGLELIKGLSEDIKATLNFETDNGTKITIKFEHDELNVTENRLNFQHSNEFSV